jgi:hypothetical protein
MAEENGWSAYRPSKTVWFWSCVACVAATMIVGFTWGGWVTAGSAADSALEAKESGRAELAAAICVERFVSAPDAGVQLAALKKESSWGRGKLVSDGGWATPLGLEKPVDGAADLCAKRLAEVELPAAAIGDEAAVSPAATPAVKAN